MIRFSLLLLAVFVMALFSACGLDVVEFSVVEEGLVGMAGVNVPGLGNFGSSLDNALSDQGVDPGDVDSMRVLTGSLEMTTQGGLTKDLSFFEKLEFNLGADGMQPTRLALAAQPIAAGTKHVDLDVDSRLDLKPYLDAGNMLVDVDAMLNPLPPDAVGIKLIFKVRVDVNVIK
ncbi:MAG TPA: hypothetical protein VM425_09205 [Myxococcota bacterium]|nr:hypothetical protein [Myxococcota bacterium]